MSENTKMPPNQDQRPRTPPGKPSQKPGNPAPSGAGTDRDRQGVNNPGKPVPEMDPDRARPDRTRPVPGKEVPGGGSMDDDDLDENVTPPIDRE